MRRAWPFLLLLAACQGDETISGYVAPGTIFALEEQAGQAVTFTATITFPEPGRVTGSGPCNSFNAAQSVPLPWIDIGPIAATRRACPDLAAEGAYFAALEQATLAEVAGDVLILSDEDDDFLVFRAQGSD